ncbi:hypothetical protein MKX03_015582 [Papaver bracteatum]|nr:hypothetical protein MKX03_015582 [Papaver bracteatum]
MFVQEIHSCAVKFPEVASTVVHLLMDFLGVASAIDVVVFVREVIETSPKLRELASPNLDVRRKTIDISFELTTPRNIDEVVQVDVVVFSHEIIETNPKHRVAIITRLLDSFYQIRGARVCSCALWIIGEYCLSLSEAMSWESAFFHSGHAIIKQCLGNLPFFTVNEKGDRADTSKPSQQVNSITVSSRRPVVLVDGTYATAQRCLRNCHISSYSCSRILGFSWQFEVFNSYW